MALPPLWYLPLAAVVVVVLRKISKRSSNLPLPPGPPRLPIIGNALDVPTTDIPVKFRDLSRMYGEIAYLDVLGQPMILLGSHEAAIDLLEKRSANYSDRNPSPMVDLTGFSWALTLQGYGTYWRRHRRAVHQFFNPNAVKGYAPSQYLEAHRFVNRLIDSPDDFMHHIRHYFGSSIMRICYGIEVDSSPVDYLKMAEDVMEIFSDVFVPGKWLVETFPILRHVPAWLPGASFKRNGAKWAKTVDQLVTVPWQTTKRAMQQGTAHPSMAKGLMEQQAQKSGDVPEDEEEVSRNATAVVYAGGADTTLSTIQSFFLAMASNPEVQAKAQAELDAVIGPHRLPEFSDQSSLPYLCAIIKELLRWRPVVPFGVPHRSLEDDEYKGFLIPKGSTVIANIWAYTRDDDMYPDPESFRPERFLKMEDGRLCANTDIRDSATMSFGFGRRICPGRHYAQTSLFIVVATVLHTLSIQAPLDETGRPIALSGKMTQGLLAYPEPFECVITPRSETGKALIRKSRDDA